LFGHDTHYTLADQPSLDTPGRLKMA
jgi:hypothetical protein